MGLGGGLTFPAMNVLVAEWAPRQERSTMSSLIYGGKKPEPEPESGFISRCSTRTTHIPM
jgi:hypothetical protein